MHIYMGININKSNKKWREKQTVDKIICEKVAKEKQKKLYLVKIVKIEFTKKMKQK